MNKNILFFFSSTTIGGAETNILKISRELSKRGYKIFWCCLVHNGPLLDFVDFEIKVLEGQVNYYSFFPFIKKYRAFVKDHQIDCVFNFGLRVELISRVFSKLSGVKKIVSNIRSTDDWRKPHHSLLDRLTSYSVDWWVSNSDAGKAAFHNREKIPLNRIKVIYNFIELPALALSNTNKLDNSSPKIVIGVLANITKEKGYFDLIKVSQLLSHYGIKHMFVCAGKDMLNNLFQQEVSACGLDNNFTFLGFIKDKDYFFSLIDIFLLPSYLEGMPTVLLEAMSFGKPVIATKVGGTSELIEDGVNGYLVLPGDIAAIVVSIKYLLDRDIYLKVRGNSFECLERFSKEKIIANWESVINS